MKTIHTCIIAAASLSLVSISAFAAAQGAPPMDDRYKNLDKELRKFADEPPPARATLVRTADLGWKPMQNVTEAFAKLLKDGVLKPGVDLRLDQMYRISGSHVLPDNVTISAKKGGGFHVIDAKENMKPLFRLGNGNVLNNVVLYYANTPKLGVRSIRHGIDFFDKQALRATDKHDILVKNCRLEGMIAIHIRLDGCKRVRLIGNHIIGGFWAVSPNVTDFVVRRCLFEKACCDGMKVGMRRALVEDCVFQNSRDGIDTTGGLNDVIVRNTIFRRLHVSGMDIKSFYARPKDLRPTRLHKNILVENCQFYDMPNAFVFTTEDYGLAKGGPEKALLTAGNVKTYAPHDVDINNCLIGHSEKPLLTSHQGGYGVNYPTDDGEYMRIFLLKDAHSIRYRNLRFSGERIKTAYIRSNGGTSHLSAESGKALDHDITGNILDKPAPPIKPGQTEAPFACGPQPLEQ